MTPHLVHRTTSPRCYADGEHIGARDASPRPATSRRCTSTTTRDEGFYVLEGEVTVLGRRRRCRVLGPGDFALGPKGVPHTYRVTARPARIIVTSSTGEFAAFVQAYGVPAPRRELPAREAPDVERLGRLAAEHGIDAARPARHAAGGAQPRGVAPAAAPGRRSSSRASGRPTTLR